MDKLNMYWGTAKIPLITFITGGLLTFALVALHSNKQIAQLKHYGDSVAVVAYQRDSVANKYNDSVKVVVGQLHKTELALLHSVSEYKKVDIQLDTALIAAATVADSNRILTQQNANLRSENLTLEQAVANVTAQRDSEIIRANKNLADLNDANADILKLNAKIQHLGPIVPGWVRTGLEVVAIGGAFYAGTQVK